MKLKNQREEGKEGTILLCSRFQHKPIDKKCPFQILPTNRC
jgi:hypothetical protein